MYESRAVAPISRALFLRRAAVHFAIAIGVLIVSLAIGMLGYLHYEPTLQWRDAFLNAAMLLGGMGPVDPPKSPGGKLFAGCYALYAGLVFILMASVILAPLVHRMMHRMHWDEAE